jgi:hypothetical protein
MDTVPLYTSHIQWLIPIFGFLWTLLLAIGGFAIRSGISGLQKQILSNAENQRVAAKVVKDTLDMKEKADEERWTNYMVEHREFRDQLLRMEQRLSHLEGEHTQMMKIHGHTQK